MEEEHYNDEYIHYESYHKFLIENENKISIELDKTILAISTLALTITLAFSKSLLDNKLGFNFIYLKTSWLFFGLSLSFIIITLMLSNWIHHRNIKICSKIMEHCGKKEAHKYNEDSFKGFLYYLNKFLHFASPISLLLGVLFIGLFFNEHIGQHRNEQKATSISQEKRADATPTTITSTKETINQPIKE